MAAIATRTFVLVPTADHYVTLAGEEYLRKLTIGNNWTTLRIGIMAAMTPDGTNNLTSCAFQIGMCSANGIFANTAGFSAASTTNYIGADMFGEATTGVASTATYQAGGGNPYLFMNDITFGVTWVARRRVATTDTFVSAGGDYRRRMVTNNGAVQRRSVVYVDITKGSPNYTVKPWNAFDISATDASYANFLTGFETPTPVVAGNTFINIGAAPIACSEVAGNFDTVSIWWNRVSFPVEIYALAVARLA